MTAHELISDWAGSEGPKAVLYNTTKNMVLRWFNAAQLRFSSRSNVLRGIWSPVIDSDGVSDTPDDLLNIVRVKWSSTVFLAEVDYPNAVMAQFSGAECYALWDKKFYVFSPSAGTPDITYIRKPAEVLVRLIDQTQVEVPQEYIHELLLYMDAMWQRRAGDLAGWRMLMNEFDEKARDSGIQFKVRNDPVIYVSNGRVM